MELSKLGDAIEPPWLFSLLKSEQLNSSSLRNKIPSSP